MSLGVKNSICNFVGRRIFRLMESNQIGSIDDLLEEARQRNESTILLKVYRSRQSFYPLRRRREDLACLEIESDSLQYSCIFGLLPGSIPNYDKDFNYSEQVRIYLADVRENLSNYIQDKGFNVIQDLRPIDYETISDISLKDQELIQSLFS